MSNEIIKIITYLNILELPTDCPINETIVKNAYKKIAKIYHPDLANERYKDGEKFKELKNAEEYLLNNISYVNSLIRNGFSQSYSTSNEAYERWKQEQEFQRRQKEEEEKRKAAEEAERKRKEYEERKRREEEQRRQQEQLRKKKIQERKDRALADAENLSRNIKKEDYFEDDYKKLNQFIMLFFNYINEGNYSNISDIDEKYNALLNSLKDIKTISQIKKTKRVKKITIATLTSVALLTLFIVLLINVIIPESKYHRARQCYSSGDYSKAEMLFNQLGNYKETNSYLDRIDNSRNCEKLANSFIKSSKKDYKKIIIDMSVAGGSVSFDYQLDGGVLSNLYQNGYYESSNKNGYEFSYWSLVDGSFSNIDNTLHLKLKANYNPIIYTISYDLCDGHASNVTTYNIETETFTLNNPTKEGYTFIGWNYYGSSESIYNLVIERGSTGNKKIIANYLPNKYTLSFNTCSNETIEDMEVTYGHNYELPTLSKLGYDFSWYYGNQKIENTGEWLISDDLVLDAKWSLKNYSISYNLNGGDASNAPIYTVNDSFEINNPTKLGYSFRGWTYEGQEDPVLNVNIVKGSTGNKEFTANWTINKYTLTIKLNNDSDNIVITQDYNSSISSISNPTREGYSFVSWSESIPSKMPATNKTIEANWTINKYTLTIKLNNGSDNVVITQDYNSSISSIDNPTREGYTFASWSESIPSKMPATNKTIEANWTINKYTLIIKSNNIPNLDDIVMLVDYHSKIPTPVTSKYTFAGWNNKEYSRMPAHDLVVYANWISYGVIYSEGTRSYVNYGFYPQTLVNDSTLINKLNLIQFANERGYYEYDNLNYANKEGKWYLVEPIKWIVLHNLGDNKVVLLSDKILFRSPLYIKEGKYNITFNLFSYLNNDFLNSVFNNSEIVNISDYSKKDNKVWLLNFDQLTSTSYGLHPYHKDGLWSPGWYVDKLNGETNYSLCNANSSILEWWTGTCTGTVGYDSLYNQVSSIGRLEEGNSTLDSGIRPSIVFTIS